MRECDFHKLRRLWSSINNNAAAIQTVFAFLGLFLILYGYFTYRIEQQRFNLDYGKQLVLSLSGSSLYAKRLNPYVSNIRVKTVAYLQISDERFKVTKPQFIELKNYLICVGQYFGDSSCEANNILQSPRRNPSYIDDLEIVFNETPRKVWATPICISSLEYTDSKNSKNSETYYTADCGLNYYSWFPPAHYSIASSDVSEKIEPTLIIGTIDFSKINKLGFADPLFVRQLLILLGKSRWNQRVTEDPQVLWWRTIYKYGNGSKDFYLKFIDEQIEY